MNTDNDLYDYSYFKNYKPTMEEPPQLNEYVIGVYFSDNIDNPIMTEKKVIRRIEKFSKLGTRIYGTYKFFDENENQIDMPVYWKNIIKGI